MPGPEDPRPVQLDIPLVPSYPREGPGFQGEWSPEAGRVVCAQNSSYFYQAEN